MCHTPPIAVQGRVGLVQLDANRFGVLVGSANAPDIFHVYVFAASPSGAVETIGHSELEGEFALLSHIQEENLVLVERRPGGQPSVRLVAMVDLEEGGLVHVTE